MGEIRGSVSYHSGSFVILRAFFASRYSCLVLFYIDTDEIAVSDSQFSSLNLPDSQLQNLKDLGYQQMTPIQQKSLPLVLKGKENRCFLYWFAGKVECSFFCLSGVGAVSDP